jgi:hypothetical protein
LVAVNEDFIINELVNPDERTALLGGPAYIAGDPDPALGAIGIAVTAAGNTPGTEIVTIRRPAFLEDVTAESVRVYANSAR